MLPSSFLHRPDLDNFVLVHTMGKVGSTALVRSLEAVNVFARHLQWLTPDTQAFFDKCAALALLPSDGFDHLMNRLNVRRAYQALRDPEYASLIKVISVIRAPIEQILSHYFHNIETFAWSLGQTGRELNAGNLCENIMRCTDDYMTHQGRTISELSEQLRKDNYCSSYFYWLVHNYINWFDQEFRPFFAVEILGGRKGDGYQIAGNALILKFEDLQSKGEAAVATYSQRPHFKLVRENVGADKAYGQLYQQVASAIRFPKEFVSHLSDSKYVRHFYSDQERRQMHDRWAS